MSIVITGAAGALGSALARRVVQGGGKVAALDVPRSAERLTKLAADLGPSCIGVSMDVTSQEAWTAALQRIERELGAPVGAVLVAGGWRGGAPLHAETDDGVWRAMIDMNLESAHGSLRALLPGMVARRRGSVVVIGSRAAAQPWTSAGASGYAASKAAVVALAQTAAAEVLESGVRINAVLPSTLDTPANRSSMPNVDPTRWVSTESLSGVIDFLLSDASRDVSGATLPVYGRA